MRAIQAQKKSEAAPRQSLAARFATTQLQNNIGKIFSVAIAAITSELQTLKEALVAQKDTNEELRLDNEALRSDVEALRSDNEKLRERPGRG